MFNQEFFLSLDNFLSVMNTLYHYSFQNRCTSTCPFAKSNV